MTVDEALREMRQAIAEAHHVRRARRRVREALGNWNDGTSPGKTPTNKEP